MSIELRRALTDDEIESVCAAAEEGARLAVQSKISLKKIEDLNVAIEAIGDKPLLLNVEVTIETSTEDPQLETAVGGATDAAFAAAEAKLKEFGLCADSGQ